MDVTGIMTVGILVLVLGNLLGTLALLYIAAHAVR
jgi:hypothetical protein